MTRTNSLTSLTTVWNGMLGFAVLCMLNAAADAQEYRSSVVGTEFDFITADDHDTFIGLEYKFKGYREMPDKTQASPLVQTGFVFVAYFEDGNENRYGDGRRFWVEGKS